MKSEILFKVEGGTGERDKLNGSVTCTVRVIDTCNLN